MRFKEAAGSYSEFIISEGFTLDTRILKNKISLILDGKTMFLFTLGEGFKFEKGTLTLFGESKLCEKNGLVGMSGAYFHPTLLSASSCEEVFDAWEWIGNEVGESFYQMSKWLTGRFVLRAVVSRVLNFAVMTPISVAVKLYNLSKSIDTKPKVEELKQALRGNVKSWTQDRTIEWYKKVEQMVRFLCNLESEFDFALFSLECGLSVKLAKRPDIYLGEIPVDVKNLSWDSSLFRSKYVRKIIERADKAFQRQGAELVGVDIGMALILLGLAEKSVSRIGRKEFCIALKKGLVLAKEGRDPVVLFYHNPWTGDVQARTETLDSLSALVVNSIKSSANGLR